MKIVIAGGTGFIGVPLVRELESLGEVVVLSRNPSRVRAGRGVLWDAAAAGVWVEELAGADAIVNLAGDSIAEGRWTAAKKKRLLESRMLATRALVEAIRRAPPAERVLFSASAIGFYGSRGEETLDELSAPGDDFLAGVCAAWESGAREVGDAARLVIGRFGIVLERDGGALPRMAMPFRMFVGGRVSRGRHWMSWVHRRDLVRLIRWAIESRGASGVYNVVAPAPVRNSELTRELGRALHRPAAFPVPAVALRAVFGEMAESLLLASQKVIPSRALSEGFRFEHADLGRALDAIYGSRSS